ncbi:MAG: IcmT/TraK family protein [Alphaproteobacteria bacterium]|nr:IcmT/TraK family protein [Alphaproteobacteria bacterium]MCK5518022.1 IcmT/TraK family protein [Alphaproteobacteria bacterium]
MLENDEDEVGWHWRNTMKPARFFFLDGRAIFFVVLVLVHARLWTIYLLIGVGIVLWILERRGLSFAAALRSVRLWFIGSHRPAWIYSRRRIFLDSGSC